MCRRTPSSQVVWWEPSASRHHRVGGKSQDEEDTLEVREGDTSCGVHQWLPSFSLHVIVVPFPFPSSSPQLWPPSSYPHPASSHHQLLFPFPSPLLDLAATSQVLILVIGLLMAVQRSGKVHVHGRVLCASPRHQETLEIIPTSSSRRKMFYTVVRTNNIELGKATWRRRRCKYRYITTPICTLFGPEGLLCAVGVYLIFLPNG